MLCGHGGDPLMANIGVMKVLDRGVVREFNPDRKETHWGKRKLKRGRVSESPIGAVLHNPAVFINPS
jgi:hypothetical protein